MALLQSGWMEALLVGVAWRSQEAKGRELVFARNLRLDEAQCRAAGLADLHDALRHLTDKYRAVHLSAEEAVTLKAVALANSGTQVGNTSTRPGFFSATLYYFISGGQIVLLLSYLRGTCCTSDQRCSLYFCSEYTVFRRGDFTNDTFRGAAAVRPLDQRVAPETEAGIDSHRGGLLIPGEAY